MNFDAALGLAKVVPEGLSPEINLDLLQIYRGNCHADHQYFMMVDLNPLLMAYPKPPPPCSKVTHCIAGILTTVYGLEELSQSTGEVASLWLLHPRLQTQSSMEPIAHSTVHAWNNHLRNLKEDPGLPGLIAVTFDQRNHGLRQVDPLANQDWRSGNDTHAQDMFANYRSFRKPAEPIFN